MKRFTASDPRQQGNYRRRCTQAMACLLAAMTFSVVGFTQSSSPKPQSKLLVIGVEGLAPGDLDGAETPVLSRLIREGCANFQVQGEAQDAAGQWASLLTGVRPNKHQLLDGDGLKAKFDQYPLFLQRAKQANPEWLTASLTVEAPTLHDLLAAGSDLRLSLSANIDPVEEAVHYLSRSQLDVLQLHLPAATSSSDLKAAASRMDRDLGRLLQALAARDAAAEEDWLLALILLAKPATGSNPAPSHGLVFFGGKAQGGLQTESWRLTDFAPTVLQHLGVATEAAWKLDGQALPLARTPAPEMVAAPELPETWRVFSQSMPNSVVEIEMRPFRTASGEPMWMSKTEIPWEVYDVFFLQLEKKQEDRDPREDGVSRPSRPVIPVDRGYGHQGYPAIGVSYHAAQEFCRWLSKLSGRTYRLPTPEEWKAACLTGGAGPYATPIQANNLAAYAWYYDNAELRPHPVGSKKPNAWGFHDMHGNVAEWVLTEERKPLVYGGSYMDPAADLAADQWKRMDRSWQKRDPQFPKSKWWLSDGPFIGFRIVCTTPPKP
ncbi:MAG: hypothetical protein DWQ01_04590 [Planctomycetota bacterium]|nr:MAG: hypothetical protein DWQ01_04590 [Planctomycetota bacterium]